MVYHWPFIPCLCAGLAGKRSFSTLRGKTHRSSDVLRAINLSGLAAIYIFFYFCREVIRCKCHGCLPLIL